MTDYEARQSVFKQNRLEINCCFQKMTASTNNWRSSQSDEGNEQVATVGEQIFEK